MKFLHAADIHLDSPLIGLRQREDLPDEHIRHCTRRAFAALIDLALHEEVAFVIIAGDLYDGDWKDVSTGLFFTEQMARLAPRPCFLLRGNHDARSLITRELPPPPNVHEFPSDRCKTFDLPELGVALHGQSFAERAASDNLAAGYCAPLPARINIGVLHTSAEDRGEHETYAPCRVVDLANAGYDYWALGHIHAARNLSERPWIVFPGNLQGRHAKETGPKGCHLVTVTDGVIKAEHRTLDVLRWASLEIDVTGLDDADRMARVREAVEAAGVSARPRPVIARLIFTGTTDLHAALVSEPDRLADECRFAALTSGVDLWVETVRVRTRPPRAAAPMLEPLRAAFLGSLDDQRMAKDLLDTLGRIRRDVPAAGRDDLDVPTDDAALVRLAEEAWALVATAVATEGRA